ncbi:Na+/H+ antiporter NhaA [Deinococcus maricopensis]|uniref:Na(+)/H(+) antiporter NhaA n=1 Tax=Deinococcus maricopensis (strain DSM 21211 / LMG 22137 / NRRL B-23946 / LB-34) TaxID=709986 RepID=E8UBZ1_DEIML|nr:Na+/H+ antiporter NhaA [Deinococcus maricopensis]ADV68580.1 Na(+)/H(+) antiporter nhaA [Deinococcus maricopensis DSM 21211]
MATTPSPFSRFVRSEAFAGLLLVCTAALAFAWANSPWREAYFTLQHTHLSVALGAATLDFSLEHWVNDGLMAVFFLLVGLEIKRELLIGELASRRRAALAVAAAVGGMLVPAALYALLNGGGPGRAGWGIPMATDIAFALGVLALLGPRVPVGLKVFLTALAIVDDLGAVLVIALFYTEQVQWGALGLAALTWGAALLAGWGRRKPSLKLYAVLGLLLWLFVLQSGLHATIAGVLLAFAVPIRQPDLSLCTPSLLTAAQPGEEEEVGARLQDLEDLLERAQSPLHRLEHALHPVVTYAVLPLFALMNAGVSVGSGGLGVVSFGVLLGLVLGKPLGVVGGAWLATRAGVAALPRHVTWTHMVGAGLLAGVGFTMSLFVANLAFDDAALLTQAKLGVLGASVAAALLGAVWLLRTTRAQAAHAD